MLRGQVRHLVQTRIRRSADDDSFGPVDAKTRILEAAADLLSRAGDAEVPPVDRAI
jgi:hypothetical protein